MAVVNHLESGDRIDGGENVADSAQSHVVPLASSVPTASLESILCTEELRRRPSRPPDYEKENQALVKLVSALADSPTTIFRTLAETIQDITQCESAGLSLLTGDGKTPHVDGKRFYWPAIAGMWSPHVGGGTPRNFGPCGDVLDQNRTLLFTHFERRYPYLMPVNPAAEECLLVPFYVDGEAVGTIWGIMHSDRRKFDAEDDRVMASLGKFASSAYQALAHIADLKIEVAEREKAEAEVRQLASGLEAKIGRLVEANVVGIVMWNLEGAITGANEAFLRMVQYDREDLLSGHVRWMDLTPAEWRGHDERAIADLKATGSFQPFEKEYFRKDGSRVPVLLGGALLERGGNEGVAFVLDLSEQKRQESARLYSEERFRVVVETASDAVVSVDDKGSILFANPATATILGYDPAELAGKPLTLIMPEYMRELHQSGFKRYLATGQRHMNWQGTELTARRRNGEEFPVEISFGEITRDGHKTFTGFLRDISKRKQAEQALRRGEAFLAEGQHVGQIGSFSWRVATDEITWSAELYRIYELEIGVPVTLELIRSRVHPEDVSLIEKMKMVDQAREGGHDFEWQYRLLMPDHSIKFMHAVAHATRDQDGQLEYMASVQDVTARRLAEEARDKARSELTHVARVMSLGTLTASIAHELNQPLSGIVTNASTCIRMLAADPPNVDGARETARRTIRDGNRASEVVARLRALFAKKEAPNESFDLNDATREVLALSSSELQRNRVILRPELADDLPLVTGDRVQLQQVILNLVRNGSDAMSGVDDRPRHLLIRTERDEGDRVRLTVQDTGVGFDPQAADRLFESFYTTKNDGMGIGLSVSRSIIESHHGRLSATLNNGPGAAFSFSIPRAPEGSTRADSIHDIRTRDVTDAA
jgi:PAS domain S-box-containing protein